MEHLYPTQSEARVGYKYLAVVHGVRPRGPRINGKIGSSTRQPKTHECVAPPLSGILELLSPMDVRKYEQFAYTVNMKRIVRISRLVLVLVTALVLATAPGVQAYQLSRPAGECSSGCACGCSCGADNPADDKQTSIDSSCGCRISDPDAAEEIPFEAQPRSLSTDESQADLLFAASDIEVIGNVSDKTVDIELPDVHAPPLYLLNSLYLI